MTLAEYKALYKFSSTQVNLDQITGEKFLDFSRNLIPDEDLVDDGREELPHITIVYGINAQNSEDFHDIVAKSEPVKTTLGNITLFETSPDFDVVKFDIISPDLVRLNKLISESTEVTNTFRDYHPHATIAYVKKGAGTKYIGPGELTGLELNFGAVRFSNTEGVVETIFFNSLKRREDYLNRVKKVDQILNIFKK